MCGLVWYHRICWLTEQWTYHIRSSTPGYLLACTGEASVSSLIGNGYLCNLQVATISSCPQCRLVCANVSELCCGTHYALIRSPPPPPPTSDALIWSSLSSHLLLLLQFLPVPPPFLLSYVLIRSPPYSSPPSSHSPSTFFFPSSFSTLQCTMRLST